MHVGRVLELGDSVTRYLDCIEFANGTFVALVWREGARHYEVYYRVDVPQQEDAVEARWAELYWQDHPEEES